MYLIIIIILVIIITVLEKKLNNITTDKEEPKVKDLVSNYNEKYEKVDYLLTKNELKFYRILRQVTNKLDYSLFCQVSLYEIVKSKNYKDFNKIKSKCIDFVITQENCKILLCIELDDTSHEKTKRIKRDDFVNQLFKDLDIKLLRIPVQNFYNMEELENKIKENL